MKTIDLSGAAWRTSTRSSGSGQCVEVANVGGQVAIRDSKDRSGPVLVFGASEWRNFLALVTPEAAIR